VTLSLLLAVALGASPPAAAAKTAANLLRVDAQEVRYNYPKGEVTLTGTPHVKLTRGDATLTCEKAVAKNDAAGRMIASAVCTGNVRFTRGERVITCDTATFDNVAGRIVCLGKPVVLRDGPTEARGARLVYELESDQVTLERAVIQIPGAELDQRQQQLESRRKGARK
jgi:lipopolysaccharide export system protein LptA